MELDRSQGIEDAVADFMRYGMKRLTLEGAYYATAGRFYYGERGSKAQAYAAAYVDTALAIAQGMER